MSEQIALVGAVDGMRMLKDGTIAVVLHFEPKDREAVMAAMGSPGASIACVRLVDGYAAKGAKPASTYGDLGPICREAIDLCINPSFQAYVCRPMLGKLAGKPTAEAAKRYILVQCCVESRKELDEPGARELFISHIREPFQEWVRRQA